MSGSGPARGQSLTFDLSTAVPRMTVTDPQFELTKTRAFLETLGGLAVEEIHDRAED